MWSICTSGSASKDSASIAEPEARGKKLNDSVYLLQDPGGKPDVELVFIHGIRFTDDKDTMYWTTWIARDGTGRTCWPATWLQSSEDFPKAARVLSLNYDSSATRSAKEARYDLYSLGETLLQEMYLANVGQKDCPVVFVCHSLGGIVAKSIVLKANQNNAYNTKAQNLLRNLKGFFFFATPHSGARLFREMYEGPAARMGPLLKSMEVLETWTHRYNDEFKRLKDSEEYKNEWKFFVAAESCATEVNGKKIEAVEYASAKHIGIDEFMEIPDTDHFTVCQPKTEDASSVQNLKEFVLDILRKFVPKDIR